MPDGLVRARVRVQKAYRVKAVRLDIVHHVALGFRLNVISAVNAGRSHMWGHEEISTQIQNSVKQIEATKHETKDRELMD